VFFFFVLVLILFFLLVFGCGTVFGVLFFHFVDNLFFVGLVLILVGDVGFFFFWLLVWVFGYCVIY